MENKNFEKEKRISYKKKSKFEVGVNDYMKKELHCRSIEKIAEIYRISYIMLQAEIIKRQSIGETYRYDRKISQYVDIKTCRYNVAKRV